MQSPFANSSRAAVWEWTQVALLALNLGWTTLCLGGYRPETLIVTLPLTGLLVGVHLASRWGEVPRAHAAGWWLLPFLAYAAANVVWITPERWLGWRDWLGWAQMLAVFWVVLNGVRSRRARVALFGVLVLLGVVAVLLACYQRFVNPSWLMLGRTQAAQFLGRASGPFGIPNSLAAWLLLILPAAVAMTVERGARAELRILGGFLVLVFSLGLVLTVSRGAWLAAAVVAVLWPLWAGRGRRLRRLGYSGVAFAVVAVVGGVLWLAMPTARERLHQMRQDTGERTRPIMWRGAFKLFQTHPVCGSGAGSYNDLFEKYRPEDYQDVPRWAHNDYLNTLSDYGAAGFVLCFGVGAGIAVVCAAKARRTVGRREPGVKRRGRTDGDDHALIYRPALAMGLAAFALQLVVDFHFKIPALAMAFAVVAALAVQAYWPVETMRRAGLLHKAGALAGIAMLTLAMAGWVWPMYRAEALRYAARQSIDRAARAHATVDEMGGVVLAARTDLARAVAFDPANAEAWADLSYAIALRAHNEPARVREIGHDAQAPAERALALTGAAPEFWARRGAALDLQGQWHEAGNMFIRALQLAPARGTFWYYHAYHLSLDATDPGRAEAAIAFCLRLDPNNYEAQALQQRLAERHRAR